MNRLSEFKKHRKEFHWVEIQAPLFQHSYIYLIKTSYASRPPPPRGWWGGGGVPLHFNAFTCVSTQNRYMRTLPANLRDSNCVHAIFDILILIFYSTSQNPIEQNKGFRGLSHTVFELFSKTWISATKWQQYFIRGRSRLFFNSAFKDAVEYV